MRAVRRQKEYFPGITPCGNAPLVPALCGFAPRETVFFFCFTGVWDIFSCGCAASGNGEFPFKGARIHGNNHLPSGYRMAKAEGTGDKADGLVF